MTALAEEFDRGKLTHVHEPWTRRMATDLRENRTAYLLLLPSVLVFALLVVFPLVSTIWGAFNSTDAVGRFTGFAGLANFRELIAGPVHAGHRPCKLWSSSSARWR